MRVRACRSDRPDRQHPVPRFQIFVEGKARGADTVASEELKLLRIASGKKDFLLAENEKLTALLKEKSIRHEWHLTGGDHSWPVWRGDLADFATRLFL